MENSMFQEDWKEQLQKREQVVIGNIITSVNDNPRGEMNFDEDLVKSNLNQLSEDDLTAQLSKSWNTMNSTQDPKKKEMYKRYISVVREVLKSK